MHLYIGFADVGTPQKCSAYKKNNNSSSGVKLFHLRVKIIGRSSPGGRSAAGAVAYRVGSRSGAAAMAYRSGEALRDPHSGRTFQYANKARIDEDGFGILHTEIQLPAGAPEWMADRQKLINAIEARERRSDAQLFREVEISLPRELTFEQQRELIRDFVQAMFVSRGMVADIAMHDERASDGGRNPHAHVLLSMREVTPEGFGNKVRAWNAKELVTAWRTAWADMANERLAAYGHERRIDARSHRDREIDLKPDIYIGPSKGHSIEGVLHDERQESRNAAKQRNLETIQADPEKLVAAVSREKATFTVADLQAALRRATALTPDDAEFETLMSATLDSPALVPIARDDRGAVRYATRDMIACEQRMAKAASTMARRLTVAARAKAPSHLSEEQQAAFQHVMQGPDLTAIRGVAGAGKTTTLAAIAAAYKAQGNRVRGVALANVAAKKLAQECAIPANTIAAALFGWDRKGDDGRPAPIASLEKGDVLIVDEAGMVGSKDMSRLVTECQAKGAKLILVGDAEQLQAIEAGAPFRALVDTHGAAELSDVRRQQEDWQRAATTLLSQGKAADAVQLYRAAGAVHARESTAEAITGLVDRYMGDFEKDGSQIILAHYKADVAAINDQVRERLRAQGRIGPDVRVTIKEQVRDLDGNVSERAKRATFARGDRILFSKNDKTLDVQNGAMGDILALDKSGQFRVAMDDGRVVSFHTRDYAHVAPGYALTVHKTQGATFDRSYVLATRSMDAHMSYVALSRHREGVQIFYGEDQFQRDNSLEAALSRRRPKDSTLDYLPAFHDRGRDDQDDTDRGAADQRPAAQQHETLSASERVRRNVERRQLNHLHKRGLDRSLGE